MKVKLLFFALLFSVASFAQNSIQFSKTSHQFGKLKKGEHKSVVFNFTNQNAKPAVIEFATAECGCTQPEYKQTPVLKGKTGTIKVTYTSPGVGIFKKKVTVKFAGEKTTTELFIEGEVVPK